MTVEQRSNSQDMANILLDNGFIMENAEAFFDNATRLNEEELNKLVGRLKSLEESMKEKVDLGAFIKEMPAKLDEIAKAFESLSIVNDNLKAEEFKKIFNKLADRFKTTKELLKAKELVEESSNNYNDIKEKIKNLDKSDMQKAFELRTAVGMAEEEMKSSESLLTEKEQQFDAEVSRMNLETLREELLNDINRLYRQYVLISDSSDKSQALGDAISKMQNEVIVLGQVIIKSKKEYNQLCEEYGIASVNSNKLENTEDLKNDEEPIIQPNRADLEQLMRDLEIKVELDNSKKDIPGIKTPTFVPDNKVEEIPSISSSEVDKLIFDLDSRIKEKDELLQSVASIPGVFPEVEMPHSIPTDSIIDNQITELPVTEMSKPQERQRVVTERTAVIDKEVNMALKAKGIAHVAQQKNADLVPAVASSGMGNALSGLLNHFNFQVRKANFDSQLVDTGKFNPQDSVTLFDFANYVGDSILSGWQQLKKNLRSRISSDMPNFDYAKEVESMLADEPANDTYGSNYRGEIR